MVNNRTASASEIVSDFSIYKPRTPSFFKNIQRNDLSVLSRWPLHFMITVKQFLLVKELTERLIPDSVSVISESISL